MVYLYKIFSPAYNSIQFNFYFSHVQRDSVQYIKNNKHLYYKGGLKRIKINLFGLVRAVPKGACCFRVGHCFDGRENYFAGRENYLERFEKEKEKEKERV